MTGQCSIMSPAHPSWRKFYELLEGPEGCNFRVVEQMRGLRRGQRDITWDCSGSTGQREESFRISLRIFKKHFPDIDNELTLDFFEAHGGFCDCEVLFNVEEGFLDWARQAYQGNQN